MRDVTKGNIAKREVWSFPQNTDKNPRRVASCQFDVSCQQVAKNLSVPSNCNNTRNTKCATRIHKKVSETFSDRKIYFNPSFRLPVCSRKLVLKKFYEQRTFQKLKVATSLSNLARGNLSLAHLLEVAETTCRKRADNKF